MELTKQEIRETVWKKLEDKGGPLSPKQSNKIPDFIGAERCAEIFKNWHIFKASKVISVNPDSPQRPIREIVLKEGKTLIMGIPRMEGGFVLLENLKGLEKQASTIKGALKLGKRIGWIIPKIDLKIVGCVAVTREGGRLGKGSGYFDLGYSIFYALRVINENIPIVAVVHPLQIVDYIPMEKYDVPVDYIITPDEIIKTNLKYEKPKGIPWERINESTLKKSPILNELRSKRNKYSTRRYPNHGRS